jgi:hypothetical protein
MKDPAEIDDNVAAAAAFTPLEEAELDRLIATVRPLVEKDANDSQQGKSELFWFHDTKVMGWQQKDEPAMVAY